MEFRPYSGKRYYGWVHPEFAPPVELLETPENANRLPQAQSLLDCRGRQIHRLPLRFRGELHSCFVYYFRNASWNRAVRSSYAFRSLRIAEKLQQGGIGTLEVLAALKRTNELWNWHSLVVAREIESVCEIQSAGSHVYPIHSMVEFSESLSCALARRLAEIHRLGFFHGDLKTRHILISAQPNPGPRFYFVDLEKCRHLPLLPAPARDLLAARDLIQLFASLPAGARALRNQFLQEYFHAGSLSPARQERIQRVLTLYEPAHRFQQGETLAAGLWRSLRKKS